MTWDYEPSTDTLNLTLSNFGFLDHTIWMLVVSTLAEKFQVLTFDSRGHGESDGEIVDDPLVVVDDLAALVDELELAPAHFAGQSGGAQAILHLVTRRPDLFRSMSLHEPITWALLGEEFDAEREAFQTAASLLRSGDTEDGIRKFVDMIGGDWSVVPEPFKALFRRNAHNYTGSWFGDFSHQFFQVPSKLGEFSHPVQLTKGELSKRLFHVCVDELATKMPSAERATLTGAGHIPMLEGPAEYATLLTDFLERTGVAREAGSVD